MPDAPATPPSAAPVSLVTKLSQVQFVVDRIKKRGRNDFHKYDYATEADIVQCVRKELASRHVMLVPSVQKWAIQELPSKAGKDRDPLMILDMTFTFLDGDSNEQISKPWVGVGQDNGDKGCYKAMTGAEKYFLLKTFLIPTGDDPEREDKQTRAATAKPDKDTKKARAALPAESGAVYIEKVTPKSRGNVKWHEVTVSTGETYAVREHQFGLIDLCIQLAQEAQGVILETHQNEKGKTELDGVRRWPQVESEPAPSTPVVANDIAFGIGKPAPSDTLPM